MDNSNIREYELNYSIDKFGAYVNNNTGRLLLDIPVTSIGMNSYYCNVNLVYNSKYSNYSFFDRQIGFNNGFKLNIEQHIFSYREEYNIPEFTEEDYVYIDSEYRIHRFTKPLYSTGNMYYDKTNGNLYLYVNSDNTFFINFLL